MAKAAMILSGLTNAAQGANNIRQIFANQKAQSPAAQMPKAGLGLSAPTMPSNNEPSLSTRSIESMPDALTLPTMGQSAKQNRFSLNY